MPRTYFYPFNTLEVGEHFYTDKSSVRSSASQAGKKLGKQFKVVRLKEDGNNHYKVERIS